MNKRIQEKQEKSYCKEKGLAVNGKAGKRGMSIMLGAQDKCLSRITDIQYVYDDGSAELRIHLSNGHEIEIYTMSDGSVQIQSD